MTVVWHQHPAAAASTRPPLRNLPLFFSLAVLGLALLASVGYFYLSGWQSTAAARWYSRAPLPVAQLGARTAWYNDLVALARGFAASEDRQDLLESDFDRALELVTRRLLIARLADEYNVTVTDDEVNAELVEDESLTAFLGEAGWDLDQYREYVLEPFVLSQRVEGELMMDRDYQGSALDGIAALQAKLDLGIAFEDVAQQYSEDSSAQAKGSLGYVLPSEVDEGLASAFALEINEVSPVLEGADAFWIVRVEDIANEADGDRYFLRGIAIKKQGIAEIVDELINEHDMIVFVRN